MAIGVSIIIPTYNRAKLLPVAVDAVVAQTHRPLQLIVINDGSKDDTAQVLASLESRIRAAGIEPTMVTQQNTGLAGARNAGLRCVKGDYFGLHDDDDVWYPQRTAVQVAELQRTGADACSSRVLEVSVEGEKVFPSSPEKLLKGFNPVAHMRGETDCHINALLVATRMIAKVGDFDPSVPNWDDREWKMRLAHEATFCAVGDVLMRYEMTPGAMSRHKGYKGLIERDGFAERALLRMRESCRDRQGYDDGAWCRKAAYSYDQFAKHRLYGGEIDKARELWQLGMDLTGGQDPLPRLKRKLLKARLLSLIGKRLKHPKFANIEDFRS